MATYEPYLGSVDMFAGNFAPRMYSFCAGQIISIASNTALFSLLGTTYGGNGTTTFGLPDLRGRTPIGAGDGPGIQSVVLGELAGTNTVTLNITEMPAHNHLVGVNSTVTGRSLQQLPGNNFSSSNQDGTGNYASTADTTMNPMVLTTAGSNMPVSIMQPYLGMNFIIAVQGVFPSRN